MNVFQWFPEDLRKFALKDEKIQTFHYPIQSVPDKISSHNLDKIHEFTGTLSGIKGQYLIFHDRVINMRKYTGYHVEFITANWTVNHVNNEVEIRYRVKMKEGTEEEDIVLKIFEILGVRKVFWWDRS